MIPVQLLIKVVLKLPKHIEKNYIYIELELQDRLDTELSCDKKSLTMSNFRVVHRFTYTTHYSFLFICTANVRPKVNL
jgi:hypothetical protein